MNYCSSRYLEAYLIMGSDYGYKIGDKVVYPNHGVGVIEEINYGVLEGRTETYYMLRISSSALKVMVPRSNAQAVGLRPVIRNGETSKVLVYIEKGKFN